MAIQATMSTKTLVKFLKFAVNFRLQIFQYEALLTKKFGVHLPSFSLRIFVFPSPIMPLASKYPKRYFLPYRLILTCLLFLAHIMATCSDDLE